MASVSPPGRVETEPARSAAPADYRIPAGLVLAGLVVLLGLVEITPGGKVGQALHPLLGYGFGYGGYLVPVVLGAFAIACFRSRFDSTFRMSRSEVTGWVLEGIALLAVIQVVDGDPVPRFGLTRGGGLLGWSAWAALTQSFGATGGAAIAALLVGLGLVLIFQVGPEALWRALCAAPGLLSRLLLFGAILLAGASGRLWRAAGRSRARRELPPTFTSVEDDWPEAEDAPATPAAALPALAPPRVSPAPAAGAADPASWALPPVTLLRLGAGGEPSQADLSRKIAQIEQTLAEFDVYVKVVQVSPGPTITQFGLEPGFRERRDRTGVVVRREKIKVQEIVSLQNDLALALAAPSIRIEAPVPGRQVVGLEVPNSQSKLVSLRQVVEGSAFQKVRAKSRLAVALGEDVSGQPVAADLARMPHLLIAGATGSGKSICINAIISCLLLQATPAEVRLILVDPKRVELTTYNQVPHLLRPVVVDADQVVGVLKWVVHEMDERYKRFEACGVRNLEGYNHLVQARSAGAPAGAEGSDRRRAAVGTEPLPFIVVVIDELADLMMLAPDDTERLLCRLAQLARATGIHLIVATQRPSVDVITGLIKANFPTRISFAVTSQIDSRTILDSVGAEKLLGRGDMLYMPTDAAKPIRLQGVFVSDEEIEALVEHWRTLGPTSYVEELTHVPTGEEAAADEPDELYQKALTVAREHTRVSTSLLQRRLRIGYARAARLLDMLEQDGVVGPAEGGGRSREVQLPTGDGGGENSHGV